MRVDRFLEIIGSDFYAGVPDSQLKEICLFLIDRFGIDPKHHIIAANEGNCVGLAAGYYLSTGKVPVVYMQNSGEGNAINPIVSLLNEKVYAIPMIFIIGWRGEPDLHDEPQHIFQGEITLKLLEDIGVKYCAFDSSIDESRLLSIINGFQKELAQGRQVAFVIRKGSLSYDTKSTFKNNYLISREEAIKHIIAVADDDLIISTTGKASRELFEIREANKQSHENDFLTVGSMGHASSIALEIAVNCPEKKVWCLDGDGALLMHMGSMAVIGSNKPDNLIHVIINNSAHETVGGMPTVASNMDIVSVAKACGYYYAVSVNDYEELDQVLIEAKRINKLSMIVINCSISSRGDLGRPTTTPVENKKMFMNFIMRDRQE